MEAQAPKRPCPQPFHTRGIEDEQRTRSIIALVLIVTLALLSGCATSKLEMAWVRTDGRKILDDPALLKQGETDIALCNANLDGGAVDEGARKCMGLTHLLQFERGHVR
jgi:hypothetical protein